MCCAVEADRFPPSQLLAQEMGDALERRLSANVEQPFAENARLKHAGALRIERPQLLELHARPLMRLRRLAARQSLNLGSEKADYFAVFPLSLPLFLLIDHGYSRLGN